MRALCTRRVQVLFDKETNTIVSNESLDIWRILDSSFQVTVRSRVGIPQPGRTCLEESGAGCAC